MVEIALGVNVDMIIWGYEYNLEVMSLSVLDSREEIAKIDLGNVLGSVEAFPQQCLDAWEMSQNISIPDSYKQIDNIVMCGMGGSGLGARVIESAKIYLQTPWEAVLGAIYIDGGQSVRGIRY